MVKTLTSLPAPTALASQRRDILVVCRVFPPEPGGIQDYLYSRCLRYPDRVVVLTAAFPGDRRFDSQQPFPIYRWPSWQRFWGGLGRAGGLLKQVWYLVCSLVGPLLLFWRYRFRYLEWGHGYDFPSLWLLSYLLPVRPVVYLHGNDLLCPLRQRWLQGAFTQTLQRSWAVVCNSAFTRDYLQARLPVATPTYVINPGVIVEKFGRAADPGEQERLRIQRRQAWGIGENAIVILSVGRLVRRKGFDRVIACLPKLLATGLDVHYVLCGRGALGESLRSQAEDLGLGERVKFAGYVPDEELGGYYAACDLFTMLTFYDAEDLSIEGFGIVYREASYFGKPVLATRIGGVPDAVRDGETGLLLSPQADEGEMVAALGRLCGDRGLRERLGRAGRELVQESGLKPLPYLEA